MTGAREQQADVEEIDVLRANAWVTQGKAVLVDVREPNEHAQECIPNTQLNPLSRIDSYKHARDSGTMVVCYCRSGKRSATAVRKTVDFGL